MEVNELEVDMMEPGFLKWVKEKFQKGEAFTIDDWAGSHKGEGVICLTQEMSVNFPVEHPKADEAYEILLRVMTKIFKGATVTTGEGTWCEDDLCEKVWREKVKVIHSAYQCVTEKERGDIASTLKKAETMTEQKVLGIKGTNKFYLIPVSLLKA